MIRLLTILFVALFLSACTHIDRQVEGWPQDLKITEVKTGFWDVQAKCWGDMPVLQRMLGSVVLACTVVNLDAGTCTIYAFAEMDDELREHERGHCRGGAHDNGFQEYFDDWMRKKTLSIIPPT